MRLIKQIIIMIPFIGMLGLLSSCVSEDRTDCVGEDCNCLRVYYTYTPLTYASSGINPKDIEQLDLFVFDSDGKFVDQFTDYPENFNSEYYMVPTLDPGEYNFVTWANLRECYVIEPRTLVKGQTTMDEMYLHFRSDEGDSIRTSPHTLLFAELHNVKVKGKGQEYFYKHLYQDTYKINVYVDGLPDLHHTYDVVITESNGSYRFDNSFAQSTMLNYVSPCELEINERMSTSLIMLRITFDRAPQFKLYDTTTETLLYQHNLVELLQRVEHEGGTVDLSYMHEFDIYLKFIGGKIQIIINGWYVAEEDEHIIYG